MSHIRTSARSWHTRSPASKSKAKAARVPTGRVRAPPANAKRQAKPAPVKVVRPFLPASDRSASARRTSAADAATYRARQSITQQHPSFTEGEPVMKTLICLTLAVSALASPALTFAQTTSDQLTRAQVRADIVRVEQAGYRPGSGDNDYPVEIQAAEAKIAEQDEARR